MASQQQIYETKILLNSEQARKEIIDLSKKVDELKRKRQQALDAGDTKSWQKLNKEVEKHEKKLTSMQGRLQSINKTLDNMSAAGPKQLKDTIKDINALLNSGTIERGSRQWDSLTASLREANAELSRIKSETKATESVWGRFTGFLNKNWGAITQILGAVTGLTVTMRKAVEDYATMEEEMANVRKYTGLADEEVRELNENFKKMDTRTEREDLNKLAGAAGRLGIQTKEGAMEFVDGANMIKVSLGDDLGEDAVDQVGKLAMAFGEDEKKGLRGAMLATGSAVNELVQNSPAKAGFLIDYTARVAGFGKQLGLTQAQIMGFGAVMDENLLRDEMAATAFGNMLTKMQTDTERFARIAGQSVEDFTKLLNEDANQAILNLADSLRSQDPQTMMKMLDDMGLDGARAVGVLSTLADKIDDVRDRQALATKAYKEGTSISKEYAIMNSTVEARLEKCKKKFHEMTIQLGEQLLPMVKYTCTGFSIMIQGLSVVTKFVAEHKGEILAASVALAAYTAYVKAATIATKIHTIATEGAKLATEAFNFVTKMNPIGLLIAALTAAVVLFLKYRDRINGAGEAMTMLRSIAAKLSGAMASLAQRVIDLIKWTVSLYDRFAFIRKIIQLLVTSFTTGFTTITAAVKLLLDELDAVGNIIEGIFTLDWGKIKEGYKQGFKAIADVAVAQFNNVKRTVKEVFSAPPPAGAGANALAAGAAVGATVGKVAAATPVEQSLPEIVVTPKKKKKYVSDAEHKQQEKEQRKAEAERKKKENEERKALHEQSKQLKAEMDNRLAEEAVSYSLGLTNYRDYIEKRKNIQLEGIRQRKALFEQGSTEYLRLDAQEKQLLAHGDEEARKLTLKEKEREHRQKMAMLEASFYDEKSKVYHNEQALNEMLFQEEMDFLQWKKDQAINGSLEQMQLEWELQDRDREHQEQTRRDIEERLLKIRTGYQHQANDMQRDIELKALEDLYKKKLLQEEDYQRAKLAIEAKYATNPAQATKDQFTEKVRNGLAVAREKAGDANMDNPWTGDLTNYMNTNEQLKQLYEQDKLTHAEYLAAKAQNLSEFIEQVQQKYQVMYESVSAVLGGISSYAKACSDYEVAVVTKNYDKQIDAAGNNEKKRKKLEEQKQKEIADIKSRANKRAMKIEIAQAVASTAMGAINAYSSAAQVPLIGYILAPVAAAAAVAAGMLQIATIKKQHQTEEQGYYEGGFTGGRRYKKEAGVVHEGEFVANHQAVQNPAILPFLNFLDQAQRNNTVGSLTMQDVSRSVGGGSTQVVAPIVNVQTDNEQLREAVDAHREATERLLDRLDEGIESYTVIDGPKGLYQSLKKYENLIKKH